MKQTSELHNICIWGVGGVGGFFGAKITEKINTGAASNLACYFIARGRHLDAIQKNGIALITPERTITGVPARAAESFLELPDPDLIMVCVKSYDLRSVVSVIRSKVGDRTIVLPLLNGADIYERIRTQLPKGIVLPACVYVGTHIQAPGVIRQNGGDGRILLGNDPENPSFDPSGVTSFLERMGLIYQWSDDPFSAIWTKYIFIAAYALVTGATGMSIGEVYEDESAADNVRSIMREIRTIARKKGIALPDDIVATSLAKAEAFPRETRTSFQRDLEGAKGRDERDLFGGTIIREGEAMGIPTPVTREIYSLIESRSAGGRPA